MRSLVATVCIAAAQLLAQPTPSRPTDPPAAAATSKDQWKGSVSLPGGANLEFVAILSGGEGTIDIPMQGVKGMALSEVSSSKEMVKFTLKPAGLPEANWARFEAKVEADGQTASGVLRQSGMELPLKLSKVVGDASKAVELKRPQEPKPPFPYASREVTYTNPADGTALAGTLTFPKAGGPFPAIVMITGSGAQDRDEALLGHKPFLVIGDHLTRNGFAVLRVDDRGVGGSSGSVNTSTSSDFAGDVLAGVEFLARQPEVDPRRIGLIGHSEGGLIAPMAASRSDRVAFIVLLAGTGVPGRDILRLQSELILKASGGTEEEAKSQIADQDVLVELVCSGADSDAIRAKVREIGERQLADAEASGDPKKREEAKTQRATLDAVVEAQAKQFASPWFRYFVMYDPRESLRATKCPVLALNGEKDLQVPVDQNLPEIERAVRAGGNTNVTVKELPGLNHLFQHCQTGSPAEYSQIEETIAPEVLDVMTSWLRQVTGLDAAKTP